MVEKMYEAGTFSDYEASPISKRCYKRRQIVIKIPMNAIPPNWFD